jgi:hypothetical protein
MAAGGTRGAWLGHGHVWHARLRPARNAFRYRAFFLRLPLRALDAGPWPFRLLARNGAGVLALNDRDHGDGAPLLDWIERVLRGAGIADADGEIWLHTLPRVLGYVFNPVSFWFCHRADGALRAIVCEVNNTFGDRHCYLLAHPGGGALQWGDTLRAPKAFHVSPFCQVSGAYRFTFRMDEAAATPARTRAHFIARIDHDDAAGRPLLQTAVGGALQPLTDRALLRALFAYPLFTFGVIARIHWQALRLWLKRVPFFPRPAPPTRGITPSASPPLAKPLPDVRIEPR